LKLSKFIHKVTFNQVGEYNIYDKATGERIINESIKRLYDTNLFGSGWPLYPKRDNASFLLFNNTAFIYDFSTSPK
jgi:hypothetical protein